MFFRGTGVCGNRRPPGAEIVPGGGPGAGVPRAAQQQAIHLPPLVPRRVEYQLRDDLQYHYEQTSQDEHTTS